MSARHTPMVYIVGAGPGDPGLITVRGLRCLEAADVVVHDHRVDPRILRLARPDAERIDVGAPAPRPMEQDAITFLLAEKAREGRTVVRLKWGDPFVFDSGAKEALFLHEQRIPFEIVPGIPAAIGGAAYAGLPVTYPEAGDVLTFVRGHEGEADELPQVDWTRLGGLGGTLVSFAGARQIGAMARALVAHGRPDDEPAALVYHPTTPAQRTVEGTLGTIAGLARASEPALLLVGAVAGLRQHLRWFDDRPLFGRRIVVTRSRDQAGELVDMLEQRGAEAVQFPTIRLAPPDDPEAFERACAGAPSFDWIVFTSANGVDAFMRRFVAMSDVRELKGVRFCTAGPATAERLQAWGVRVALVPDEFRADGVAAALKSSGLLEGARILLPRGDLARDVLPDELRGAGADVTEVTAYRAELAPVSREGGPDIYRMLLDREIDAVTFTSASTVRNFAEILGPDQAADLLHSTAVAAIGPVTAEAAQQLGIAVAVIPERYTVPDLVDALVEHFRVNTAGGDSGQL